MSEVKTPQKVKRGRRRPTAKEDGQEFILMSNPISAFKDGQIDQLLFASPVGPTMSITPAPEPTPLSTYCCNYEKYDMTRFTIHLTPLTAAASVGGYTLSLVWFPDASESPTSLQATNLSQNKRYHRAIGPGQEGSLTIPRGKESLYVDASEKQPCDAYHGQIMVVLHGDPMSTYQNTQYLGPLFRLEVRTKVIVHGYSPQNIPPVVQATTMDEEVAFVADANRATLQSTALLALSRSVGERSESTGSVIYQTVMGTADTIAGSLPFPLSILAKVGLFFVRKIVGSNGKDTFVVYKSLQDATANRPVFFSGRTDMVPARLRVAALGSVPQDGSSPSPPPEINFTRLHAGGTYSMKILVNAASKVIGSNWPVQRFKVLEFTDMATGVSTTTIPTVVSWATASGAFPVSSKYGITLATQIGPLLGASFAMGDWGALVIDRTADEIFLASTKATVTSLPQVMYEVMFDLKFQ